MKSFITALMVLGFTGNLMAVELSAATNQQLLDEVYRRMIGSPTGQNAIANYICDSDRCTDQVKTLNAFKSKIYNLSIIAVCDAN